MIPVVITASAYTRDDTACLAQARKLARENGAAARTLLIDAHPAPFDEAVDTVFINLAEWLDAGQNPRREVIRAMARSFPAEKMIVLDGRHYDVEVLSPVIEQAAAAWFHLDAWQPAFVLIVDDFDATRVANSLFGAFQILPLSTAKSSVKEDLRLMKRQINKLRMGSGRISRYLLAAYRFLRKCKHYAVRKLS